MEQARLKTSEVASSERDVTQGLLAIEIQWLASAQLAVADRYSEEDQAEDIIACRGSQHCLNVISCSLKQSPLPQGYSFPPRRQITTSAKNIIACRGNHGSCKVRRSPRRQSKLRQRI
jgi:hypothetical protein